MTRTDQQRQRVRQGRIRVGMFIATASLVIVVLVVVGIHLLESPRAAPRATASLCSVHVGSTHFALMLDQAQNATTIAAIGKQMGLPDRGITVALAAAFQESRLHNLPYGDMDSLGLFQQRPSQGWGTPAELLTPRYAATVFFQHLVLVDGWESAPVTVAAQAVQRSASPSAYAEWEPQAQLLMQATTGEVAAGLGCQFLIATVTEPSLTLSQAISQELGPAAPLGIPVPLDQGWTIATWLVAHAQPYGIESVSFAGRRWTPETGSWDRSSSTDLAVRVGLLALHHS